MKKAFISPKHLKALRDRKGWSRSKLSELSGVTERSIASYETAPDETVSLTQNNFRKLTKALRERPDVLSGQAPLPEEGKPHDLHVELSPQVRLNFDLIKKKYGVDIMDIINVAPLLFVAAAEESLQHQQERLEEDTKEYSRRSELMDHIASLSKQFKRTYFALGPDGYTNEDFFLERWHAIKNNDLFETYLCEPHMYDEGLPRSEYPNPFADYLYEVSKRPRLKGTVELTDELEVGPKFWYSHSERIPDHRVCLDILDQTTLGSEDAKNALEHGVVSISEIPHDFWQPRNAGKRVEWLEDKYRQSVEQDKVTEDE